MITASGRAGTAADPAAPGRPAGRGVRGRFALSRPRGGSAAGVAGVLALAGAAALARRIDPSSTAGVALGVGAAVSLGAVMLYSLRRAVPAVRWPGATRRWLHLHLWGGALFVLLFVLHAGLGPPRGAVGVVLWALSLWVVATGVGGAFLQRAVPRLLGPAASFEVHLERVPELVAALSERAERAAAEAEPRVKAYHDRYLAPDLAAPRLLSPARLFRPRRSGAGEADVLERTLLPGDRASLEALHELHRAKHELDVHFTLQRLLGGWLAWHLPAAVALLGLVGLHVFLVIWY